MKTIFESKTHKIQIPDGAVIGDSKDNKEREWRDSELQRTDLLSLLTDHPKKVELKTYRVALRNYPATPDFALGKRPTE